MLLKDCSSDEISSTTFHSPLDNADSSSGAKDRVFALIAISSTLGIVPDYSVDNTIARVSLDLSIRTFQSGTNLHPLAYACCFLDPFNDLHPSWAINISGRFHDSLRPYSLSSHLRIPMKAPPRFNRDHTVLILTGRILDYIAMSALPVYYTDSFLLGVYDSDHLSTILQLLSNWTAVLVYMGITLENVASLCRAVMGNPNWSPVLREGRSLQEQTAFYLWSHYRYYVFLIKNDLSRFVTQPQEVEVFEGIIVELAKLLLNTTHYEDFSTSDSVSTEEYDATSVVYQNLAASRSCSVTKRGLICNGMHEVKEGDAIAILQGGDRLFILRPVGDKYRLVGDAYVPGLMLGEAYEGLDPDDMDYDIEII